MDILNLSEDEFYSILKPSKSIHGNLIKQEYRMLPKYDFSEWDRTDLSDVPLGDVKLIAREDCRQTMIAIVDYGMGNVNPSRTL